MKRVKIKIIGLLALAGLMIINPVYAQRDEMSRIQLGIKGGLNVSNMYANDVNTNNAKLGANGGLFLKVALIDRFSFQPELLYTMKGAELKYQNSFVSGTANFSLDYVEVPFLAVFNLTQNFNIQGGLYVASLTRVKIKNQDDAGLFDFEREMLKEDFETIDYGFIIGMGGDFNNISIGIRYEIGLKTVGKERSFAGQIYRFPDARNSLLQFYLGIGIL